MTNQIQVCPGLLDPADPKWREKAREERFESTSSESTPAKRIHVDSDSGEEVKLDEKEPAVKSDHEALKLTDMLLEYSRNHGRKDLSLAINKVNNLLQISRLQKLKQSRIDTFFTK